MDKTVVVRVDRFRQHKLYRKRLTISKTYHVHDPKNQLVEGDKVSFKQVRPISKNKRWAAIYK